MDNRAVVERIMKNLAFDLETVPKSRTGDETTTSSSKTDPLNLKIRVRKKEIVSEPNNQGFISNNQSEPEMVLQKIRLVNSDKTIMSFDMFMEAELEKKATRKHRKHIFDILKPGLCLGAADDDDQPYMPSSDQRDSINENSSPDKSNAILRQPFALAKNTYETFGDSNNNTKREKLFLGRKCKPGGCLDPPFGEDHYAYKPRAKEPKYVESTEAIKETVNNIKPDIKVPENKKNKPKDLSINDKAKEPTSLLSLYKAESPTNSVITYPPDNFNKMLRTRIPSEGDESKLHRNKPPSEDKSRQSVNDSMNSFFSLPKGSIIASSSSALREPTKRHSYSPKSRKKSVETNSADVKPLITKSVSLDSVPLEQNTIETNDDKLMHEKSPVQLKPTPELQEIQHNPIMPYILPHLDSIKPIQTNKKDVGKSPSAIKVIDPPITVTKEISIQSVNPTYSSFHTIPKMDVSNFKESNQPEQTFDTIPVDKEVEIESLKDSQAINSENINKKDDTHTPPLDSYSAVEQPVLKRIERNESVRLQTKPEHIKKSFEIEQTNEIDNTPDIQEKIKPQIVDNKHIEDVLPHSTEPRKYSIAKIKSEENNIKYIETAPIQIPKEKESIITIMSKKNASIDLNITPGIHGPSKVNDGSREIMLPTDADKILTNIEMKQKSFNQEIEDYAPRDNSVTNNLKKNDDAESRFGVCDKEKNDSNEEPAIAIKQEAKDEIFPKDIDRSVDNLFTRITKKSAGHDNDNNSKPIIEKRDKVPSIVKDLDEILKESDRQDSMPFSLIWDEKSPESNQQNSIPQVSSIADKRETSNNLAPKFMGQNIFSNKGPSMNDTKNSDKSSSIDQNTIISDKDSPIATKKNSPDGVSLTNSKNNYLVRNLSIGNRKSSPDRNPSNDKRKDSPNRVSLIDNRRISTSRGSSTDKSKKSPDRAPSLDIKNIMSGRGSLIAKKKTSDSGPLIDIRNVSPGRDSKVNNRKMLKDKDNNKNDMNISPDRNATIANKRVTQKPVKNAETGNFKEILLASPAVLSTSDLNSISLDLAFHSYINNRNERILSTVDVRNKIKRYPNDSIIFIKSQIKLNTKENNEFSVPIDPKLDMAIEIKKNNESSKPSDSKTETRYIQKFLETQGSNRSKIKSSNQKVLLKRNENDKVCSTLTDIYEKELVPLQNIIRDLKQEIDTLTAQQTGFKKKVLCQKKIRPRLFHSNKKCN